MAILGLIIHQQRWWPAMSEPSTRGLVCLPNYIDASVYSTYLDFGEV